MDILSLVFLNQRDDLKFVFKFRKISKKCKNFSEEWLIKLIDHMYIQNVNITQFRNLRELKCSIKLQNKDLRELKYLHYLDVNDNRHITNNGIKHLNLNTLLANHSYGINDRVVGTMINLQVLEVRGNRKVTDKSLKYLQLDILSAGNNPNITDNGVRHMNLLKLEASAISGISNNGIKHMINLIYLDAYDNKKITDDVVKNMHDLKFLNASHNTKITDKSVQCLKNLTCLYASHNPKITNISLNYLNLELICAFGNPNITEDGIKHMTNCKLIK